jgi:hypothetical protein
VIKLLGASVLLITAFVQGPTYLLDLTDPVRSTDAEYESVPTYDRATAFPLSPVVPPGVELPLPPLEVTNFVLDKTSYFVGESYLSEFKVRNVGIEPVKFPIDTRMHPYRRSMPDLRRVRMRLEFKHPVMLAQSQFVEDLYGADSVHGSLVTLAHDQTILVRASGKWQVSDSNLIRKVAVWPTSVGLELTIGWSSPEANYGALVTSLPATIALTKQQ